jgi:rare lipoprotein A
MAMFLLVGGCAETEFLATSLKSLKGAKGKSAYKIGDPYEINGAQYTPRVDYGYSEAGIASWYGKDFHGKATANGETYNMEALTAAHRTLPLPSIVRVTNLENGRMLIVRVNDRGPFSRGRIIDVSKRGAELLGFQKKGTAMVRVDILPRESRTLAAKLTGKPLVDKDAHPPPFPAPRVDVTSKYLTPLPNGKAAAAPTPNHKAEVLPNDQPRKVNGALAMAKVDGTVSKTPVEKPPEVYIQAGAYRLFVNANRAKTRLRDLGRTRITEVPNGRNQVFRVRIGPLDSVDQADALLMIVSATGFGDARIVID